jgi:hypothetical protein
MYSPLGTIHDVNDEGDRSPRRRRANAAPPRVACGHGAACRARCPRVDRRRRHGDRVDAARASCARLVAASRPSRRVHADLLTARIYRDALEIMRACVDPLAPSSRSCLPVDEFLTVAEVAEILKLNPQIRRSATGFSAQVPTLPLVLADVVDGAWTHRRMPRWRRVTHRSRPIALTGGRFDAVYSTCCRSG